MNAETILQQCIEAVGNAQSASSAPAWVVAIAAVLGVVVTGVGVGVAWKGLSTWRRQLRGASEYDLARRVMVAVYRVRDVVKRARSQIITGNEYTDRPGRNPSTDLRTLDAADYAYILERRLQPVDAAREELEVLLLEAEAVWGALLATAWSGLRKSLLNLNADAAEFVDCKYSQEHGEEVSGERLTRLRHAVHSFTSGDLPDEIGTGIEQAVTAFEAEMRPRLGR